MWDTDFDSRVERTKRRPLASGELKIWPDALLFLGTQLSTGLFVLTRLNYESIALGAASVPLVALYPLAKRYTKMPQLVLGVTFNWGALLGYCAVTGQMDLTICGPLYLGCVSWTFMYDTLYAHQDKRDDARIGLNSSALTLGDRTLPVISVRLSHLPFSVQGWSSPQGCAALSILGIGLAGHNAGLELGDLHAIPFYASLGVFGAHLAWQIRTADLDSTPNLAARFRSNAFVAPVLLAGIATSKYMAAPAAEAAVSGLLL